MNEEMSEESGIWNLVCEEHLSKAKEDGRGWVKVDAIENYNDPCCDVEDCEKEGAYEVYDLSSLNEDFWSSSEWKKLEEI